MYFNKLFFIIISLFAFSSCHNKRVVVEYNSTGNYSIGEAKLIGLFTKDTIDYSQESSIIKFGKWNYFIANRLQYIVHFNDNKKDGQYIAFDTENTNDTITIGNFKKGQFCGEFTKYYSRYYNPTTGKRQFFYGDSLQKIHCQYIVNNYAVERHIDNDFGYLSRYEDKNLIEFINYYDAEGNQIISKGKELSIEYFAKVKEELDLPLFTSQNYIFCDVNIINIIRNKKWVNDNFDFEITSLVRQKDSTITDIISYENNLAVEETIIKYSPSKIVQTIINKKGLKQINTYTCNQIEIAKYIDGKFLGKYFEKNDSLYFNYLLTQTELKQHIKFKCE